MEGDGLMASTVADLITRIRRHVANPGQRNKLNEALDASETDVTFEFTAQGIQTGARISVDLEDMHVWSVSSLTATVERGQYGTTAATHADDSIVWVNPSVSAYEILQAVNEELLELPSPIHGVWQPKVDTFTYTAGTDGYDLAADVLDVVSVAYNVPGSSQVWPVMRRGMWRFNPQADSSDFPSGRSLSLIEGGYPGQTVRVTYKAPFTVLSTLADNVASISGLPARAHAILEYGAAIRLQAAAPVRNVRTDAQGDTRRAAEVSTSDILRAPARLEALHAQAVTAEATLLQQMYGV